MAAACRRDQEALSLFCDHFSIPGRFTDYREMLDKTPLDAVVISSPHVHHYGQARECLERGLHVLLEKPLCLTVGDGKYLAQLARKRQRVLLVALNPPYWAHCHLARRWIGEGRIGTLEAAEITWINSAPALFGKEPMPEKMPGVVRPTSFRADASLGGGGHLMDGGQHNVSELLWVTGQTPVSIAASMNTLPVDLRAAVSIALDRGAIATLLGLVDSRAGVRRAHSTYYGSEGTLRIEVAPFRLRLERPGAEPEIVEENAMPAVPSPAADLLHCIRTGEAPLGSPEHALETTHVIQAAYDSASAAARWNRGEPGMH